MKTQISILLVVIYIVLRPFEQPEMIRATVYTASEGAITADGSVPAEGFLAGKREWLGYKAVLYEVAEDGSQGDLIGEFEFRDTGAGIDTDGDGKGDTIREGKSIDVYCDTLADCKEWVKTYGDYVYLQIIYEEEKDANK
jgi:hypothetical protein